MNRFRSRRRLAPLGVMVAALGLLSPLLSAPAYAASSLIGSGSSFAAVEVEQWTSDVAKPPYSLNVDYTSTNSGDGRYAFANQTIDFAVSDIPYQPYPYDTKSPSFAYMYVPVTAGGLAFMYHINGIPTGKTLQLSSYSACAVMTGGVPYWDDAIIKADNPGVALPHTVVHPVTRGDQAGTNYVFQEYCIHEQPNLWASFVNSPTVRNYPGQVNDLSASTPHSDWPLFPGSIAVQGSPNAADTVSNPNNDGYITAVETAYAVQRNFPVASVKNASGDYTQPTPLDVASALAYATQQANGTHILNFDGAGPHVYNPSTYSYLLSHTSGWDPGKGATLSQFADYALTLGQQKAPQNNYASLGLSLEQYGVKAIQQSVPGAVPLTAAEQGAYACGDLTPSEVAAGQTTPTCGVLNANNSTTPGVAAKSAPAGSTGAGSSSPGAHATAGTGGRGGGATSTVDPAVSLGGSPALAFTGADPLPLAAAGAGLVVIGMVARRRLVRGAR